jgi:hypothetical protein
VNKVSRTALNVATDIDGKFIINNVDPKFGFCFYILPKPRSTRSRKKTDLSIIMYGCKFAMKL